MINRKIIKRFLFLGLISISAGCLSTSASSVDIYLKDNPDQGVIIDVPFVKQKDKYCGPAALSSIFLYWNKNISQEEIAKDIFFNELGGVLNIDLEKYARSKGFWAKESNTDFQTLKTYLRKGIPVIAMERLHPYIFNKNHFVVITGFSDKHGAVIQHTGDQANVIRSYKGFMRNWYRAGGWILKVVPLDKAEDHIDNKEDLMQLGVLLEKQGYFDKAMDKFQKILDQDKDNFIAYFNLGNVYMRKKQYKEAEKSYKKAIQINKDFADSFNNLAFLYLQTKKFDLAHEHVNRALSLKSKKKFYFLDTKAQIYLAEKNYKKAKKFLKIALRNKENVPGQTLLNFKKFWIDKIPEIGQFFKEKPSK